MDGRDGADRTLPDDITTPATSATTSTSTTHTAATPIANCAPPHTQQRRRRHTDAVGRGGDEGDSTAVGGAAAAAAGATSSKANKAGGGVERRVDGPEAEMVDDDDNDDDDEEHRTTATSSSLPLCYDRSELFTLGSRPGMECMPLRSPPGPYHYHVTTDQTKSLQELQNEVGALLEFRDLVIETFPDLKHKMASISASNTITGLPTSSLASRRDWEPGIRVRRKLTQKEHAVDIQSSSSLIRSRSNSHSGKKEPKSNGGSSGTGVSGSGGGSGSGSGEGNGSVVQDSGFSTETSSSKEAHSASSTTAGATGTTLPARASTAGQAHQPHHHYNHPPSSAAAATAAAASAAAAGDPHRMPNDADDELWNLLDVIHRKSMRLRDEVDRLQSTSSSGQPPKRPPQMSAATSRTSEDGTAASADNTVPLFHDHLDRLSRADVQILRKERDKLLSKLFQMEGEALADRIQSSRLQDDMEALQLVKSDLEAQLQLALSQKVELSTRIQHMQHEHHHPQRPALDPGDMFASAAAPSLMSSSSSSTTTAAASSTVQHHHLHHSTRPATTVGGVDSPLGRLDGVVSTPGRSTRVRVADSKKFEAILLETNIVELQRHLLTITVQNQVLTQRLEQATKSKLFLNKKLVKAKEDIDDLRFQLEEKSIDLEGTRAQLRIVETKSYTTTTGPSTSTSTSATIITTAAMLAGASQVSTPSMKAMTPLAMDDPHQHHIHNHNSSSTESAQDQTELDLHAMLQLRQMRGSGSGNEASNETPRKRPSKIPLPGTKGYLAPKPPTGRSPTTPTGVTQSASTSSIRGGGASGPPSNRSLLSRSTGSLVAAQVPTTPVNATAHHPYSHSRSAGPHSGGMSAAATRRDYTAAGSLHRPESALSLSRKDGSSLSSSRSSSIPVSSTTVSSSSASSSPLAAKGATTTTPTTRLNNSPLPRPKRETFRGRHQMDSLTRAQQHPYNYPAATSGGTAPTASNTSTSGSQGAALVYKAAASSKKDLSSSFSQGQTRKASTVAVRRVSSASVGGAGGRTAPEVGGGGTGGSSNDITDNGKMLQPRPSLTPHSSHRRHQTTPAPSALVAQPTVPPAAPIAARRNLIGAYLARNAAPPPAIFKPSFQAFSPPPALQLAYTHPALLLLNDEDDEEDEGSRASSRLVQKHQNHDNGHTYITDSSSIEMLDKRSPLPLPPAGFRLKRHRTAFASVELLSDTQSASTVVEAEQTPVAAPRLIGNVTATLIKTWEQLNAAANAPVRSTTTTAATGAPGTGLLLHSSASGDFYDSIDDDDDDQFVSELERIPSMCDDAIDDEELRGCGEIGGGVGGGGGNGGEAMAVFGSLDKRKMCWSMDSS